ncbi:MAG: M20 family peptidase [Burkholderiales bacterium]
MGTVAPFAVNAEAAAARLSQLIRFPTVSFQDSGRIDHGAFAALREYIRRTYPQVHRAMTREDINGSLLYRWPGTDASLAPILLMAHLDVVPGEEGGTWAHPPFSGDIADGFVWGRGALDVKGSLGAILEAAEVLVKQGFTPRRTVYLAFGHDEEIGGKAGNGAIAAKLKAQGVKLHAVLDEGSLVAVKIVPNVSQPVALIGIAEKGYLTLELSVEAEGGHASMPAVLTNAEILARALQKVMSMRNAGMLTDAVRRQLHWLAPELPLARRLVLSNLWLFEPLVKHQMSQRPPGDAMLRTTIAPTMLKGSDKENILPHRVSAVVNFRPLQGTTVEQVIASAVNFVDDERVKIAVVGNVTSEPSAVSTTEGEAFGTLHRSIREAFPDALVAPSLVLGSTDSRYYRNIAQNIYRFIPVRVEAADVARFHGRDERIALKHYAEAIGFYARYLHNQ